MRNCLAAGVFALLIHSSLAAAEMEVVRNVAYRGREGHFVRHRLDLYKSPASNAAPVVVWVHGGGWKMGSKRLVDHKPEWLTARGCALVSINYRFYPDADYAEQAADVAAAVRWVHDHAVEHNLSPDRIFLMGHSAGAHLAALVATDRSYLQAAGVPVESIAGVVLIDGAGYDIPAQMASSRGWLHSLYAEVFSTEPDRQQAASPITHVAKETKCPPLLILHCANRSASSKQAEALAGRVNEAGGQAATYAAERKNHLTINRDLGTDGDAPTAEVAKFLEHHTVENPVETGENRER